MTLGQRRRLRVCRWKVRYLDWDTAEAEGLRIWRTRRARPNPAIPYPCDHCDGYHLALSPTVRRKGSR